MKKYIFPILLILLLLVSFIIIQEVKNQHNSAVKSYDKQLSDLKKSTAHYENKNKSYELLTDSLKTKYLQSKSLLEKQMNQNNGLRYQIKNLVYSSQVIDTSKLGVHLNPNDSLTNLVVGLALSSSISDSLCKLEIERLEKITKIQAQHIAFCDSNFRESQLSLQTSIEKNKNGELENQVLKRQVKRNRLIGKLEGSVLILTATVLSTLLLTH